VAASGAALAQACVFSSRCITMRKLEHKWRCRPVRSCKPGGFQIRTPFVFGPGQPLHHLVLGLADRRFIAREPQFNASGGGKNEPGNSSTGDR
jgi:hypothetical protein